MAANRTAAVVLTVPVPGPGAGDEAESADPAAAARRARFGSLPAPVRLADTVEERPATVPDPARDAYNSDEWLVRYCL
jgi:hypothetical protein